MELHNNSLCYAFPYQNMEFHITKILKEIILLAVLYVWVNQTKFCLSLCYQNDNVKH